MTKTVKKLSEILKQDLESILCVLNLTMLVAMYITHLGQVQRVRAKKVKGRATVRE